MTSGKLHPLIFTFLQQYEQTNNRFLFLHHDLLTSLWKPLTLTLICVLCHSTAVRCCEYNPNTFKEGKLLTSSIYTSYPQAALHGNTKEGVAGTWAWHHGSLTNNEKRNSPFLWGKHALMKRLQPTAFDQEPEWSFPWMLKITSMSHPHNVLHWWWRKRWTVIGNSCYTWWGHAAGRVIACWWGL